MKYLIIGLTAKERPVTMTTVKAIGFLFSRIMNFSPLCVTPPLHSQPLRLEWSLSVLEIPRFCLIICQTREKQREKNIQGSTNAAIQAGPWTNPTINSVLFNEEYEILMKTGFFFLYKFHFWLRRHLIWLLLNSFRMIRPELGLNCCAKWIEVN